MCDHSAQLARSFWTVSSILLCLLPSLVGCDLIPREVAMNDPRIQPLLTAAQSFDRTAYGFTPLPQAADVRWESRPTATYDAMLHITARTSRTIAFRKTDNGWRWIGDQEIFDGPKIYRTVDGTFHEHISLTYEIEGVSGVKRNERNIDYAGEDKRLAGRTGLSLAGIKPILKEWGY